MPQQRRVVWSYAATADLKSIAAFISGDSKAYATSFVRRVKETSRSLETFPERGRVVPEFKDESIREIFV
jgi:plasmid stabilization system protein ParE